MRRRVKFGIVLLKFDGKTEGLNLPSNLLSKILFHAVFAIYLRA